MANKLLLRQKYHQYRIYSPAGVYLGLLQNVDSPFQYNQTIASVFTQLQIIVSQSADVADLPVTAIMDEAGNPITDEAGNNLLIERQPDVVGSTNSNALIANGNQVIVYEYSNYYPNGLLKFTGYISKWKTTFGGSNDIVITCISNGQDLNNYLVPGTASIDQSQTSINASFLIYEPSPDGKPASLQRAGQTFTTGAGITTLSAIEVWLAMASTSQTMTLSVWSSPAAFGGTPLATATAVVASTTMTGYTFTFATPLNVTPNTQYFFSVQASDTLGANIYLQQSDLYAGGTMWFASYGGGGGSTAFFNTAPYNGYDLAFTTFFSSTSVAVPYTNVDPTFILNDIMKNYIAGGGQVAVPPVVINNKVQSTFKDATLPNGTDATMFSQTFTPKTTTQVDILQLYIGLNVAGPITYTISLIQGNPALDTISYDGVNVTTTISPSNTVLGSNISGSVNAAAGVVNFLIPQNAQNQNFTLQAGTQYYIALAMGVTSSGRTQVYGASSGETPSDTQVGRLYIANVSSNTTISPTTNNSFPYMYFAVGLISPFPQSTSLFSAYGWTLNLATYTFKLQTMVQAIQTLIGLSPATWYWYVDPATNVLQFAQASTTADITVIRKRHINEIDIEATKENIKNVAYFSGGDNGTGTNTNIFVQVTSAQGNNRVGLALLSDNKVNSNTGSTTTAKLIAQNYLNINSAETYITNVTIQDQTIDINLFKLGMMVGFSGFGNFVDNLLLQIVGVNYQSDQIVLQLGTLPKRDSQVVAALQAGLQYAQTVANPNSPS